MLVFVPGAFFSAKLASANTRLNHCAKHGNVLASPPDRQLSCRSADICAVEATANALAHVHSLGRTRVCAGSTHDGAEHRVTRCSRQLIVEIFYVGVKGDDLVNGHRR
jgi:hypothetical protein